MHGFWYSARRYFRFSRKEIMQIFWTSLAFGFILSFGEKAFGAKLLFSGWGKDSFNLLLGIIHVLMATIIVFFSMWLHVALQKLVAIKLGYTANYIYWTNGILLSILLVFLTGGFITFILPGAAMIDRVSRIRLGKFRQGTNLKDIARVALAGPVAHIIVVLIMGLFYFNTGKGEFLFSIIFVNLLLAIYTVLPIPKIDAPQRMDSGSDGLGMFYFSRTLYILVLATVVAFAAMVLMSINVSYGWLFTMALILGCIFSGIYSLTLEQKN